MFRRVADDGQYAGVGRSAYSDLVGEQEEFSDNLVEGVFGIPRRMWDARKSRRPQISLQDRAKKAAGFGERFVLNPAAGILNHGLHIGNSLMRAAGGGRGLTMGLGMVGAQIAGGALRTVQGVELGMRTALTGGLLSQPKDAVEAYFPGWKRYGFQDVRKYGLNPRIPRRYVALQAARGVIGGLSEALNPSVAPPSIYVDAGGQLRHRNDMGAHAGYGQKMLGPNSILSTYNQMSMQQKMSLLDAII
jgi:hypothetical protein